MAAQLLELQRPQYPSSPEVLLSSLAWSVVPRAKEGRATGLIYERLPASPKAKQSKVELRETMPRDDKLVAFTKALHQQGFSDSEGGLSLDVGRAVAGAIRGIRPQKGAGSPSSAIGVAGALLQDTVGGLSTKNPPNFAHIFNTFYVLGGANPASTAAETWFKAAAFHASEGRLRRIELALANTVLPDYLQGFTTWPPKRAIPESGSIPSEVPTWWQVEVIQAGVETPFSWYRKSWDLLCSPEWRERLPPRRWASWAICVLRHALAFSYLWEANFFLELARGVLDRKQDSRTTARWALVPVKPLVPYQRGSISQMDVMPGIRRNLSTGLATRKALESVIEKLRTRPDSLSQTVDLIREKSSTADKARIASALTGGGDVGGLPNLLETVRYSLLDRGSLEGADNFSLLKVVSRRFAHVSPGAEWIVVMSAMATVNSSSSVRLGDVMKSVKSLGLQPRIDFLLNELERGGLCASAPDGDEGIQINLGFGHA